MKNLKTIRVTTTASARLPYPSLARQHLEALMVSQVGQKALMVFGASGKLVVLDRLLTSFEYEGRFNRFTATATITYWAPTESEPEPGETLEVPVELTFGPAMGVEGGGA